MRLLEFTHDGRLLTINVVQLDGSFWFSVWEGHGCVSRDAFELPYDKASVAGAVDAEMRRIADDVKNESIAIWKCRSGRNSTSPPPGAADD